MPEVGDELIYRLRDDAASERVRVVDIDSRKRTSRYVLEFLDDDKAGAQENVPSGRLRGPWAEVEAYDELMANWERIGRAQLTDIEQAAVEHVFGLLIPEEVAEWEWSRARFATTMQERLGAAEAENRRLDELITRLFDELKRLGHAQAVNHLIRTHEEDRITPAGFRPVVDRPLKPSEIPVSYERAPRRWGH